MQILRRRRYCITLQFADGSSEDTVGTVRSYWTFKSGARIPVTFEVLKFCASNVVLGEDFVYDCQVFSKHTSLVRLVDAFKYYSELAPFNVFKSWQQKLERVTSKAETKFRRKADEIAAPLDAPSNRNLQTLPLQKCKDAIPGAASMILVQVYVMQRFWKRTSAG